MMQISCPKHAGLAFGLQVMALGRVVVMANELHNSKGLIRDGWERQCQGGFLDFAGTRGPILYTVDF